MKSICVSFNVYSQWPLGFFTLLWKHLALWCESYCINTTYSILYFAATGRQENTTVIELSETDKICRIENWCCMPQLPASIQYTQPPIGCLDEVKARVSTPLWITNCMLKNREAAPYFATRLFVWFVCEFALLFHDLHQMIIPAYLWCMECKHY